MRRLALVVLSGCGRLAFDPLANATGADGAVTDGTVSAADLVVHMPFDATLLDEVARGHDANCFGGPCPTRVASPHGMAAVFTGQECLQIPFSQDFQLANFTAAAWVQAGSNPTDADVFSRPLDSMTTSQNSFEIFIEPSTGYWQFVLGTAASGTPMGLPGWHHLAMTYGGGMLAIYLDGVFQQMSSGLAITYGGDPLFIGCDLDNNVGVAKFTGQIDDVRLYGRVLTSNEIALLATE